VKQLKIYSLTCFIFNHHWTELGFLVNKTNRCTEFGVYVGFIYKESVTMHGHTIVKFRNLDLCNIYLI